MSRKRNKVMKNSSGCHDINKVIRFFFLFLLKICVIMLILGESRRGD